MSQSDAIAVRTPRDSRERFFRTPEQMELDHQAAMMRGQHKTFQQIGEHFGVARQTAFDMVRRAIEEIPKTPTAELIALELSKLDDLERRYYAIMEKHHVYVSASGKVVYDGDERLEDDGPLMKAMEGLLKVTDRRARLLGLNAPTRTELTAVVGTVQADHSEQAKAEVWGLLARLASG